MRNINYWQVLGGRILGKARAVVGDDGCKAESSPHVLLETMTYFSKFIVLQHFRYHQRLLISLPLHFFLFNLATLCLIIQVLSGVTIAFLCAKELILKLRHIYS